MVLKVLTPYWLLTSNLSPSSGVSRTPARPTPSLLFTPAPACCDMLMNSSELRGLICQRNPVRYWTQATLPPSVTPWKVFGANPPDNRMTPNTFLGVTLGAKVAWVEHPTGFHGQ